MIKSVKHTFLFESFEKSAEDSLKVTFEEEKEVWLCQCKQTKTPPFCDGSHRNISQ